jgi:hypothetical protein
MGSNHDAAVDAEIADNTGISDDAKAPARITDASVAVVPGAVRFSFDGQHFDLYPATVRRIMPLAFSAAETVEAEDRKARNVILVEVFVCRWCVPPGYASPMRMMTDLVDHGEHGYACAHCSGWVEWTGTAEVPRTNYSPPLDPEDNEPTDCAGCGSTVRRPLLDEDLRCSNCRAAVPPMTEART